MQVLAQPAAVVGEDHATLLDALEQRTFEFREDVLAEQLFLHQTDEVRDIIQKLLICHLPIPLPIIKQIIKQIVEQAPLPVQANSGRVARSHC